MCYDLHYNIIINTVFEQVNLAEQLTSSDSGVSTGLINQGYWKTAVVFCKCRTLQPRNKNVSFQNNSNVAMDLMVFVFYSVELVIDVETGIVTKYFLDKMII